MQVVHVFWPDDAFALIAIAYVNKNSTSAYDKE